MRTWSLLLDPACNCSERSPRRPRTGDQQRGQKREKGKKGEGKKGTSLLCRKPRESSAIVGVSNPYEYAEQIASPRRPRGREKGVAHVFAGLRGRPRGRKVDCRPSRSAVCCTQPSVPSGVPRVALCRSRANSASVTG